RRRHTRFSRDWSSDVCSSDLIEYREIPVELNGGETAVLMEPTYRVQNLNYGPLHPDTTLSPRLAPPMLGLGLLEAIHEEDILAKIGRASCRERVYVPGGGDTG